MCRWGKHRDAQIKQQLIAGENPSRVRNLIILSTDHKKKKKRERIKAMHTTKFYVFVYNKTAQ